MLGRLKIARRGASAVEFALIVPILTLMVFAVLQYGVLMFSYNAMFDAARTASRKLATGRATASEASTAARASLPAYVARAAWTINPVDAAAGGQNQVSTTISIPAEDATILSLAPMPPTLTVTVVMLKEG